jgi:hypothetical protein
LLEDSKQLVPNQLQTNPVVIAIVEVALRGGESYRSFPGNRTRVSFSLIINNIKIYKMDAIDKKSIWMWLRDIQKDKNHVGDGVFDISDIDFINPNMPWKPSDEQMIEYYNSMKLWVEKYPNFVIAEAYQTEYPLFLSEMPTKVIEYVGSGFNHGSNNIIDNCPKRILICGEDD